MSEELIPLIQNVPVCHPLLVTEKKNALISKAEEKQGHCIRLPGHRKFNTESQTFDLSSYTGDQALGCPHGFGSNCVCLEAS